MAKGTFLFKIKEKSNPTTIANYLLVEIEGKLKITSELMNKISTKQGISQDTSHIRKTISYREDWKYFSIYVGDNDKEEHIFLVFVLDLKESTEPFTILLGEVKQMIIMSLSKGVTTLQDVLKGTLNTRNDLMLLIHEKERIEKKISTKANKLLDEGNFVQAQEIIKLAKEIPAKISDLVKRGDDAFTSKNYRVAERCFIDASDFSKKINEIEMSELLKTMAERAAEIPRYMKDWAQNFTKITKPLKKMDKREKGFYLEPIDVVNEAIDISDILEDDQKIELLQQLESLMNKGDNLSKELDEVDSEINKIIEKLNK
jgi:hypothetical protein